MLSTNARIPLLGLVVLGLGTPATAQQTAVPEKPVTTHPAGAREAAPTPSKRLLRYRQALAVLETSHRPPQVFQAMNALRAGYPESRPILLEARRSPLARVRAFAVKALGELGTREDLETIEAGLFDVAETVRSAAILAVGHQGGGDTTGAEILSAFLPREPQPRIRRLAVRVTAGWKVEDTAPILVKMLRGETNDMVRTAIFNALRAVSKRDLGNDSEAWEAYAKSYLERKQTERLLRQALEGR